MIVLFILGIEVGITLLSLGIGLQFVPKDEIRRIRQYGRNMKRLDVHGLSA